MQPACASLDWAPRDGSPFQRLGLFTLNTFSLALKMALERWFYVSLISLAKKLLL